MFLRKFRWRRKKKIGKLIYGADVAMYWAKSTGKNRVGDWRKLLGHRADGTSPWYSADRAADTPDVVVALGAALAAKDPTTSAAINNLL